MDGRKLALGIVLFMIGLIGIASLLTMDIPLPPEARSILEARYSATQIRFLTLVNPTIMLVVAVTAGTLLYKKVNLRVPVLEKVLGLGKSAARFSQILKYGFVGGVTAGILIVLLSGIFNSMLPAEFQELGQSLRPSLAARFLYGGFTEEILMRFGVMTLAVWGFSKLFRGAGPSVYWLGIVAAAVLFALGHFPIAFQSVAHPTVGLLLYILIGNSIGGLVFGWLYWKKGLESAFVAHISAHLVMFALEPMLQ